MSDERNSLDGGFGGYTRPIQRVWDSVGGSRAACQVTANRVCVNTNVVSTSEEVGVQGGVSTIHIHRKCTR